MESLNKFLSIYEDLTPPPNYELEEINVIEDNFNNGKSILDYMTEDTNKFSINFPELTPPGTYNNLNYYNYTNYSQMNNASTNLNLDIEDLLRQEGITQINNKPIRFGSKSLRTSGKPTSHHRRLDKDTGNASARDISIVGGTTKDYEDFKNILLNNKNVKDWMQAKNWGIINEITPQILSQTKGTGNHFHFGPDIWARNTWQAWLENPSAKVTTSYRYYKPSNNTFIKQLNQTYRKVLTNKGLDPNYSYMLVAQDVQETGWNGEKAHGDYNYGNISTNGNNWHVKTGKLKWTDYKSMEDFVNKKIDYLARDRYKFFDTFTPNSNVSVVMQTIANKGYNPSDKNYGKLVEEVYNSIIKKLT